LIENSHIEVIELESCGSTNDAILLYIKKGSNQNPVLLISDEQTAGKGQRGKQWLSPKNAGWYFSLYLPFLNLPSQSAHLINWVVLKTLLGYFYEKGMKNIQFKWPNDLYTDRGKLGGILVENNLQGNTIKSAILGIGINQQNILVNDSSLGTTSLEQENVYLEGTPKDHITQICTQIIDALQKPLVNLESLQKYLWQFAFGKDRSYNFNLNGENFVGQIKEMKENGFLVINDSNTGKEVAVQSGSLVWLNEI